jgi:hypothetical protein
MAMGNGGSSCNFCAFVSVPSALSTGKGKSASVNFAHRCREGYSCPSTSCFGNAFNYRPVKARNFSLWLNFADTKGEVGEASSASFG